MFTETSFLNNVTWEGNTFSGTGNFLGPNKKITGTFTDPYTISGCERCSARLLCTL
jgi:hypothetical protein